MSKWHDEPDVQEVIHELEVRKASIGTVTLPSASVEAAHVLVGAKKVVQPPPVAPAPAAPDQYFYYYRLMFHTGPRMRVSEYLDAGADGALGDLRTISGLLSFDPFAPRPSPAEGYVFLGHQILAGLDAIKNAIRRGGVFGAKGEKLLATRSQIRVARGADVDIHYETTFIAEEAAEAVACNPCPIP